MKVYFKGNTPVDLVKDAGGAAVYARNLLSGTTSVPKAIDTFAGWFSNITAFDKMVDVLPGEIINTQVHITNDGEGQALSSFSLISNSNLKQVITKRGNTILTGASGLSFSTMEALPAESNYARFGIGRSSNTATVVGTFNSQKVTKGIIELPTDYSPAPEDLIGSTTSNVGGSFL